MAASNKFIIRITYLIVIIVASSIIYSIANEYIYETVIKFSNAFHVDKPIITYHLKSLNLSVKEYHGWNQYRLGDMVGGYQYRKSKRLGFKFYTKHYRKSIAFEYMTRTNDARRYDILIDIIKKRTNINKKLIPLNNTLVIHLRTGDTVDIMTDNYTVNQVLTQTINRYVKTIPYYQNILPDIKQYNITNIMMVTGWHKTENHTKSTQYIDGIINFFQNNHYNVSIRINENPDNDFVFMCNSKYFLKSGGGFSYLIANIVRIKGGIVLGMG